MTKDLLKTLDEDLEKGVETQKKLSSMLYHIDPLPDYFTEDDGDFLTDDEYEVIYGRPRV